MNTATDYAQTLLHMSQDNPNAFPFDKFTGLLQTKGQYKMLPEILQKYQQLLQQESSDKTTLLVRDSSIISDIQAQLDLYAEQFGTEYTIIEDKNIVGGFILKNKTNMVDQSYRSKLIGLYKKLVA